MTQERRKEDNKSDFSRKWFGISMYISAFLYILLHLLCFKNHL